MSSRLADTSKELQRMDFLFSKFAAFYGHLWRSQFKDEAFLHFAKKEWHEGLSQFTDTVLNEAIRDCREFYEMPPTLPQMIFNCRNIRKRKEFIVKQTPIRAQEEVVTSCIKRCRELLA